MKNIYQQILDKQLDDSPLVLATVTGTTGSTPRKPGSSALFGPSGLIAGTVGGGIVEERIQQLAKKAANTKASGHYHFRLDNDISEKEEAICGGQITILLDATINLHKAVLLQIKDSILKRIPGVLVTRVAESGKTQVQITRQWVSRNEMTALLPDEFRIIMPEIKNLLATGNAGGFQEFISSGVKEVRYFLEPIYPLPHLVIAGAGHIGKALAHLGKLLEFEVTVIDDRADLANKEIIPDADHLVVDDIGHAVQRLKKTLDTYIVIVTRGHKNDSDALRACLGSEAGYVGMIGSRKKIALMRNNFLGEGWVTPAQWETVHTPIGIDIHSETVQEIAISIAAQLVEVRNHKVPAHA